MKSKLVDLVLFGLKKGLTFVLYTLQINLTFMDFLFARSSCQSKQSSPPRALPVHSLTAADVCQLLVSLRSFHVCSGNSELRFLLLSFSRKGCYLDASQLISCMPMYIACLLIFCMTFFSRYTTSCKERSCAKFFFNQLQHCSIVHIVSHTRIHFAHFPVGGRHKTNKTAPSSHVFLSTSQKIRSTKMDVHWAVVFMVRWINWKLEWRKDTKCWHWGG